LIQPDIIFQDQRFVVLNKPAGLAVHPTRTDEASVEDWFPLLSRRNDGPWLAHRLDKDTAGCLLVALRKQPLLTAQALFAAGGVEKTYWAIVAGTVAGETGVIDRPIRKISDPSGWRMANAATGPIAQSRWRVLGRSDQETWIEMQPLTGRTHQVRLHCQTLGCPVLGDTRYGGGNGPLHLLARTLRLPLDPPIEAQAEPPRHMLAALHRCGYTPSAPVA
jgi:tRNA pseudouridine32 synthase / 23S rRNA pseudouridine746 synthase